MQIAIGRDTVAGMGFTKFLRRLTVFASGAAVGYVILNLIPHSFSFCEPAKQSGPCLREWLGALAGYFATSAALLAAWQVWRQVKLQTTSLQQIERQLTLQERAALEEQYARLLSESASSAQQISHAKNTLERLEKFMALEFDPSKGSEPWRHPKEELFRILGEASGNLKAVVKIIQGNRTKFLLDRELNERRQGVERLADIVAYSIDENIDLSEVNDLKNLHEEPYRTALSELRVYIDDHNNFFEDAIKNIDEFNSSTKIYLEHITKCKVEIEKEINARPI